MFCNRCCHLWCFECRNLVSVYKLCCLPTTVSELLSVIIFIPRWENDFKIVTSYLHCLQLASTIGYQYIYIQFLLLMLPQEKIYFGLHYCALQDPMPLSRFGKRRFVYLRFLLRRYHRCQLVGRLREDNAYDTHFTVADSFFQGQVEEVV